MDTTLEQEFHSTPKRGVVTTNLDIMDTAPHDSEMSASATQPPAGMMTTGRSFSRAEDFASGVDTPCRAKEVRCNDPYKYRRTGSNTTPTGAALLHYTDDELVQTLAFGQNLDGVRVRERLTTERNSACTPSRPLSAVAPVPLTPSTQLQRTTSGNTGSFGAPMSSGGRAWTHSPYQYAQVKRDVAPPLTGTPQEAKLALDTPQTQRAAPIGFPSDASKLATDGDRQTPLAHRPVASSPLFQVGTLQHPPPPLTFRPSPPLSSTQPAAAALSSLASTRVPAAESRPEDVSSTVSRTPQGPGSSAATGEQSSSRSPTCRSPQAAAAAAATSPSVSPTAHSTAVAAAGAAPSGDGQPCNPSRIRQREKQVQIGKQTLGYERYFAQVPKEARDPFNEMHPTTPRVDDPCGKREFDKLLSAWRRALHKWDDVAETESAIPACDVAPSLEELHLQLRAPATPPS